MVSGATGMVGKKMIEMLLAAGHSVHALTRRPDKLPQHSSDQRLKYFFWDADAKKIDPRCVDGIDAVIHLAGENIGAKPWTKKRKAAIYKSRVDSMELILQAIIANPAKHQIDSLISASASGYYRANTGEILHEEALQDQGFLGKTCVAWENVVQEGGTALGVRAVSLRCGVILSPHAGLLKLMIDLFKYNVATILGNGKQYMPWVSLQDTANAYIHALNQSEMTGSYNLAATEHVTTKNFMNTLARHLKRRLWLPRIPAFLIKLGMGQQSTLVLDSVRLSNTKLRDTGFDFHFDKLDDAMADLLP